ncbi:hypothetical protein BaRGS_00035523 [Batillaria attramentaria]|uniref:Uncharacterized protein n=1 Tax=Batillaria attramentaria TaxID=370345 RepID=A0ABD0JEL0_9CAEN
MFMRMYLFAWRFYGACTRALATGSLRSKFIYLQIIFEAEKLSEDHCGYLNDSTNDRTNRADYDEVEIDHIEFCYADLRRTAEPTKPSQTKTTTTSHRHASLATSNTKQATVRLQSTEFFPTSKTVSTTAEPQVNPGETIFV